MSTRAASVTGEPTAGSERGLRSGPLPFNGSLRPHGLVIRVPGSLLYRGVMSIAIAVLFIATGLRERVYGEVIFGVLALVFAVQTLRIRVVAARDGLSIRNLVRSYRIPWREVDALDVVDAHLLSGVGATGKIKRHRLVATTKPGARVVLQATQSLYHRESGSGYLGDDSTPRWEQLLRDRWRSVTSGRADSDSD